MASSSSWADFESHKNSIRHNTVAKLQSIISGWTDQCRVTIPKSGKKQDLIDRMTRAMVEWRDNNQLDKWLRAKAVLDQVRDTGQYNYYAMPPEIPGGAHPQQTFPASSPHKLNGNLSYPPPAGAGPPHLRYDAYAPPRKAAPSSTPSSPPVKPGIRFRSSPFYRVVQPVSQVIECPESTSHIDRRSQGLSFTLTSEQLGMLQAANSKHQLRLFCTSSLYHLHHHTGFRSEAPCPIEFPATCEVRVNNVQLNANLKGLKKKPGTAPPPDLGKAVRLTSQVANRVEMVYVNSQQPVQHKKFYIVVYLVEVTTVEQLVEKLRKGKYRSESDIREKMVQSATFDDDIIAGPQKMSLKCPLSYMRVSTPCRSIHCPHAQCFDATSWFAMMEQTTTWLCPVCEKILNVEELIIDGYFDRILVNTPESIEDVVVEADGEWHTSDDKFASEGWRASHPLMNEVVKSALPNKDPEIHAPAPAPAPAPSSSPPSKTSNASALPEVITLSDSEDDEERIVKRELSPRSGTTSQSFSFASSRGRSGRSPPPSKASSSNEVIDLTLDSDDDVPPPKPSQKRKERETDDAPEMSPSWKKPRFSAPSGSGPSSGPSSGPGSGGYGGYVGTLGSESGSGAGLNGKSSVRYGESAPSGANGWGLVRIPIPAPPHSPYQAPLFHAASSTGMPVQPQNINGSYTSYGSVPSRSDLMRPRSPVHAHMAPYYNNHYGHPPPGPTRGEA